MGKKRKKKKQKQVNKQPEMVEMKQPDQEVDALDQNLIKEIEEQMQPETKPLEQMREGLGEELIGIYEASGDELSSVTTFEHKRRTWQKTLIWILSFVILLFIGVAAVSWFIWGRQPKFTGDNVSFDIEVIEEVASGSKVQYVVSYGNKEATSFRKAEIELRYPAGFVFEQAEPEPTTGDDLFNLSSVPVGEQGEIVVEGYLVGTPDTSSTISGVFRYWPANFSSEFNEVASAQVNIVPMDLEVDFQGPDQILVGQTSTYTLVFENKTEDSIRHIAFEPMFPDDFTIDTTSPELEDETMWVFDEVPSGEQIELQIDGYFGAAPEEDAELIVLLKQKANDDDYFDQNEYTVTTKVVAGDLLTNLIINGSTKNNTIQWGDVLNGNISFTNNSEAELSDLRVVASIETRYRTQGSGNTSQGALDWQTLVDANRGAIKDVDPTDEKTLRKRTITWTGEDLDILQALAPEEDGELNFQISLRDLTSASDIIQHPEDIEVAVSVEVIVGQTGGVEEEVRVASNPIRFLVDTDLVLDAEARYYADSGEELGSGPLPPTVGEKTTYQITWKLTNTLHEAQDIIVSAELPDNVAWLNDYEITAGEAEFDAANNTLSWRLNKLPLTVDSAMIIFDVQLTPNTSQIGEVANLTRKMTMTATDADTAGKIIQTILPLTTGVDRDEQASDKGIVVN